MKLLKELYKIYSPSGGEKRMRKFVINYVKRTIPRAKIEVDKLGNLYITKGVGESFPCIVAHMDQVQERRSRDFKAYETKELIFGYSMKKRKQEGLGADDKNGIWVALKSLERYDILKVVLFVSEEVGCIGSGGADLSFFDDCRFVIGVDRKGCSDLITEINWMSLCSDEFIQDIEAKKFGYKESSGFITDVGELKQRGLPISCINLSCGYYEAHSDFEVTVKADLLNCFAFVCHIIENCTEVYAHTDVDGLYEDMLLYDSQYDDIESDELAYLAEELLRVDPHLSVDRFFNMYSMHYPHIEMSHFEMILEDCRQIIQRQNKPNILSINNN